VYSRTAIALGLEARGSFVEVYEGAHPGVQRHSATIMTLAKGAKARHVAVVGDGPGLHIETQICGLADAAELDAFGLVSGGGLARRQIFIKMTGKDAKVSLGGLALVDGERRTDTTLQVVHSAPRGTSREFYRAIVDDDAIGVFQGKIIVERAAQKTDGAMKAQAVLLSPRAQMNQKPELEIFADDVICGHGATVASLDPEQVFYLQSRGIADGDAKAMLLEAFGGEAIDRIGDERLIGALRGRLRVWLGSRK
jgi:Fe-S cluster assembly protein SufD